MISRDFQMSFIYVQIPKFTKFTTKTAVGKSYESFFKWNTPISIGCILEIYQNVIVLYSQDGTYNQIIGNSINGDRNDRIQYPAHNLQGGHFQVLLQFVMCYKSKDIRITQSTPSIFYMNVNVSIQTQARSTTDDAVFHVKILYS